MEFPQFSHTHIYRIRSCFAKHDHQTSTDLTRATHTCRERERKRERENHGLVGTSKDRASLYAGVKLTLSLRVYIIAVAYSQTTSRLGASRFDCFAPSNLFSFFFSPLAHSSFYFATFRGLSIARAFFARCLLTYEIKRKMFILKKSDA